MKQKVHSVSYLAKAEFELKNGVYDLVALPAGAEVVKVSLELAGNLADVNINVGFKDEPTKNYFLTSDDVALVKNEATKKHSSNPEKVVLDEATKTFHFLTSDDVALTITSAKDYTATSNKVVVAEVQVGNHDGGSDTKGVLRVLYFLPSVIEVEY